jgi:hypothetical protein
VRKEEVIQGGYLRTLSDSFGIPVGTIGKVDMVGKTWQGEFVFTVRWQDLDPARKSDRYLIEVRTSRNKTLHTLKP